jgi:hypothetical protein
MTNVLIVSKTHMHNNTACIGGLDLDTHKSLRLLTGDRANHPSNTNLDVGQIWDITYKPSAEVVPPHLEDVVIQSKKFLRIQGGLRNFLLQQKIPLWRGDPSYLFEGMVRFTGRGSGYISKLGLVPNVSTGYWLLDQDLHHEHDVQRNRNHYVNPAFRAPFVGFQPPINTIPAGTLLRLSLARWWRPSDETDVEERCYVQISGWYL